MRAVLLLTACALAASTPAFADAIDGNWCREGRQFTIEGPQITTPSGQKTRGDYGRHSFFYTVPDGEPEAGAPIAMRLVNEETVRLSRGSEGAQPETWRRCSITS